MSAYEDRLGDLSWVGHPDKGWFVVGQKELDYNHHKKIVDEQIKSLLYDSSDKVSVDNVSITKGERIAWLDYRKLLKEIYLQPGYPFEIDWPKKPD